MNSTFTGTPCDVQISLESEISTTYYSAYRLNELEEFLHYISPLFERFICCSINWTIEDVKFMLFIEFHFQIIC